MKNFDPHYNDLPKTELLAACHRDTRDTSFLPQASRPRVLTEYFS